MFSRPQWVILLLIIVAGLVWLRAPNGEQQLVRTALVMGTLVEIKAFGEDEDRLEQAISAAFAEMRRLEALFTPHNPESEVSRLSAAAEPLRVSAETAELLQLGLRLARETGGAFDLALGRLKQAWGIETDSPQVPSVAQLERALAGIGPEALRIDGRRVSKRNAQLRVELGGIAKGYAVDRALTVLRQAGISSAAVNAGGDIGLLGDRQGQPWRIAIQHPRKADSLLTVLPLADRAVVTSGDYERYFERNGVRYHHIFDPRTGHPARRCQSVTVVAADAASADALATAAFVLGPQQGLMLLERLPGVEGLLVGKEGDIYQTSGLQRSDP